MADMSLRGFVYRNGGFYMSENILRIQNVEKYYGSRNNLTKAIDDISFDVNKGEFVAIMGASGSGKTTLLNCISTIDKVTSGNIYVDGNNITQLKGSALNRFRRDKLGFIFHDFNLLDTLTAYENIALALSIRNHSPEVIDRAVNESCVTISIVACNSLLSILNLSRRSLAALESRAPVGSSASTRLGLVIIALAEATLCFCPPDIW